jgi:hypothetical protein
MQLSVATAIENLEDLMRSGIEIYLIDKLAKFRVILKNHDRAVLLGAALSFTPIFPACFFGLIISLINFVLIHKGATDQREGRLVKISLAVGFINSLLWVYLFMTISESFGSLSTHIFNIIFDPFDFFKKPPPVHPSQRDLAVEAKDVVSFVFQIKYL